MRVKEIFGRITGFSVPVFGVSWNPPEQEVAVARRVLAFLEDRRVLYNPYRLEVPHHCVASVLEIRSVLTDEIGRLSSTSKLADHLRGIRAACRKYLDHTGTDNGAAQTVRWMGPEVLMDLGELRASIGLHVAAITVMHGLDVTGDLAGILPQRDDDTRPTPSTALRRPGPRVKAPAKRRKGRAARPHR
jgi:hypothetical protein